jgi:hypothetical protein
MKIRYLYISLICAICAFNSCKKDLVDTKIDLIGEIEKDTINKTKKDTVIYEVKPDIESLYFLRNADNHPKNRVTYYEVKNTEDTYHMIRAAEVSFHVKYSPTGEIEKFENLRFEGDYKFNEFGLPMALYDEGFLEREYFYNEKRALIKVNEYHRYVKEFLRQYTYEYEENGRLTKFIDNVTSGELKDNTTIKIYPNLIISSYSHYGILIKQLNRQQLPVKVGNNDIVYSVDNNEVTVKVFNEDKSVFTYYTISFDENNKPSVPGYSVIFPYQHYDNMVVSSLLSYSNRNPLKIVQYTRNLQGVLREYIITTYTYKYNTRKLPTEVYKVQETKTDGGASQFSKQVMKIEYEE